MLQTREKISFAIANEICWHVITKAENLKNLPKAFWFGAFKQLIICIPKWSLLHFYSNYNILNQVSFLWFEMLCKFSLLLGIRIHTLQRIFKRENPYFHSKILRKSVDISATFLASLFTNNASFQSFSMLLKYTIKLHSLLHNHTTPKSNSFLNYLLIGIIYVPIIYDTL